MNNDTRNRLLRVLDSLRQTANYRFGQSVAVPDKDVACLPNIPPGSIFEDQLPVGRQPRGLFWCPDGIPAGRATTLLSSRLGHGSFEDPGVSRALRSFFASLDNETLLVSTAGITLDTALQRGSQLFGINLLRFLPFPRPFNEAVALELRSNLRDPCEFRVYFESEHYAGSDHLLLETCDHCRLVSVRKNGNLHRAIRDHWAIASEGLGNSSVLLCLVDHELTPIKIRDELGALGCHDWWLYSNDADIDISNPSMKHPRNPEPVDHSGKCAVFDQSPPVIMVSDLKDDLLSHWTRAVQQSWPDRNALSQWDVVWFGKHVPRGTAGTLLRILAQQTILGSGSLVRGGQPMSCFTEVPLVDFPRKRVFRSHLSRWDFEPFGVSIRRSALETIGARPVQYLTRQECDSADKAQQPWLVPADSTTDWTKEREWRVAGNVDLRVFPADSVYVFVADLDSAELIRPFSRWPVVVLGESAKISESDST